MDRKLTRSYLHILIVLILMIIFALVPAAVRASLPGSDTLRVALHRYYSGVRQITISSSTDINITRTGSEDHISSGTGSSPATLIVGESGISLKCDNAGPIDAGKSVTISPADASGIITVESPTRQVRKYRGSIEISLRSGFLHLVNVIDVENYLMGSVPAEMPSTYPIEALKAQVIAARTYALENHGKHAAEGCDVCDTTHCQVYGGVLAEKAATSDAVAQTKGQVLTYEGQLASTLYCADCGGVTQSFSDSYGGRDICYLHSVTEPEGVAHSSWQKTYKLTDLAARFERAGIREADGLKNIKVSKTTESGRVLKVEITGAQAAAELSAVKLRKIMPSDIRSTLFTIETSEDGSVTIKGKGWGHGIGLCQVGAKALAAAPFNYSSDQILSHYYPGTNIASLPSTTVNVATVSTPQAGNDDDILDVVDSGMGGDSGDDSASTSLGENGSGPDAGLNIRISAPSF